MNYTAFTAVIFSFHHVSSAFTVIFTLLLFFLVYWLLMRKLSRQRWLAVLTFLGCFTLSFAAADKLFGRLPLSLEIVQAGN